MNLHKTQQRKKREETPQWYLIMKWLRIMNKENMLKVARDKMHW